MAPAPSPIHPPVRAIRPTSAPIVELVSIQYLRATAAVGVVVWHAQGQMGIQETTALQAGIEMFFVISGYVMWLILTARPVSPGEFLRKRIIRVVPLYWVLTTVMVGLLIVAPQLLQSTRFDIGHVVASYLFVAWPNPVAGVGLKPVMIPGWTLNYEMFFYALLALSLMVATRFRAVVSVGVLASLALLSLIPLPPVADFYASPFMMELGFGILLAIGLSRAPAGLKRYGPYVFVAGCILLAVGAAIIGPENHGRLVLFGIPATMIVGGLVTWEGSGTSRWPWRMGWLKRIGDASYPLYMIHPVLLSAMAQVWRRVGLTVLPGWSFVVVGVVVTCLAGWVAHLVLERPLIAAFKRKASPAVTRSKVAPPGLATDG